MAHFQKCAIFTGPDLKRARRTGLSARRVQRMKSRGLKGLQLEVGARRAARLLVFEYFPYDNCHQHDDHDDDNHQLRNHYNNCHQYDDHDNICHQYGDRDNILKLFHHHFQVNPL